MPRATTDHHPATRRGPRRPPPTPARWPTGGMIPHHHGAVGKSFFMKRAPTPRPDWLAICAIEHASGNVIDFPMIQDVAALLWVVNLGCIDLNQWYARCDDVDRPDYLHFDLDPTEGATFARVLETARRLPAT